MADLNVFKRCVGFSSSVNYKKETFLWKVRIQFAAPFYPVWLHFYGPQVHWSIQTVSLKDDERGNFNYSYIHAPSFKKKSEQKSKPYKIYEISHKVTKVHDIWNEENNH